MSTLLGDTLEAGSVLEIKVNGEWASALVLLATDSAVILDACDGSTPVVYEAHDLPEYRIFQADPSWN